MDDLESLELFSLVSRVTNEFENHLGIADKTLAEFVIDQHLKCNGKFSDFKKFFDDMGGEFPQSLLESVDRMVLTMHPKYKGKKAENANGASDANDDMDLLDALEQKSRVFKGLAVPDTEKRWEEEDYIDRQAADEADAQAGAMDDTFAMLEGLAGKAKEDKPHARGSGAAALMPTITTVDGAETNTARDQGLEAPRGIAKTMILWTSSGDRLESTATGKTAVAMDIVTAGDVVIAMRMMISVVPRLLSWMTILFSSRSMMEP